MSELISELITSRSEYDNIIRTKIEKSIELICQLYGENLITDAYIIGSIAKGTTRKESDIDIIIINPDFEFNLDNLDPYEKSENIRKVVNKLKNIGTNFKIIEREKYFIHIFWYQLYNGEMFHILPQKYFKNSLPHIQITRELCNT